MLLPTPLWGRVGVGGREMWHSIAITSRPPPPTPPHKGEGSRKNATAGAITPPHEAPPLHRPISAAAGGPAAGARAGPLCGRYLVSASAAYARRAFARCAWPDRGDRHRRGARHSRRR